MDSVQNRVCPVERAGSLDHIFRRWLQNPIKILKPFITQGMTAMDYGCGPGFFTIDMAQMVGGSGKVIAVDLQKGMLAKLEQKIRNSEMKARIELHQCEKDSIGITRKVDFVLAFYVVHEIPDQGAYFRELRSIVQPEGQVLVVEPPIHVSKSDFQETIQRACDAGFESWEGPSVLLSKSVILNRK